MEITLKGLSKRFGGEWLFKNLSDHFALPGSWAITGPNGSGKTTLLQIIAGMIPPTQGEVEYQVQGHMVDPDQWYRHLWLSAPYMELLEELTLKELLEFHFRLKPPQPGISVDEMAEYCQLSNAGNKPLNKFSSGMKQRVKLALGFFSKVPVLLLDEPGTNLDAQGFEWYYRQVHQLLEEKLIIICSNQPKEYDFCSKILDLGNVGPVSSVKKM